MWCTKFKFLDRCRGRRPSHICHNHRARGCLTFARMWKTCSPNPENVRSKCTNAYLHTFTQSAGVSNLSNVCVQFSISFAPMIFDVPIFQCTHKHGEDMRSHPSGSCTHTRTITHARTKFGWWNIRQQSDIAAYRLGTNGMGISSMRIPFAYICEYRCAYCRYGTHFFSPTFAAELPIAHWLSELTLYIFARMI